MMDCKVPATLHAHTIYLNILMSIVPLILLPHQYWCMNFDLAMIAVNNSMYENV